MLPRAALRSCPVSQLPCAAAADASGLALLLGLLATGIGCVRSIALLHNARWGRLAAQQLPAHQPIYPPTYPSAFFEQGARSLWTTSRGRMS